MELWQNLLMNKFFAFMCLIFASNIFSQQEINKSFYLECELLDQVVMSIDQGKSAIFKGWKDGIKEGQKFYLKFRYTQDVKNNFNFRLTIPKEIKGINSDSLISMTQSNATYETSSTINFERGSGNKRVLLVGFDSLTAKDEWSTLDLNRYYKNDWELLFFHRSPKNYQSGTANCMGMPKEYDEVLSIMQEIYDNQEREIDIWSKIIFTCLAVSTTAIIYQNQKINENLELIEDSISKLENKTSKLESKTIVNSNSISDIEETYETFIENPHYDINFGRNLDNVYEIIIETVEEKCEVDTTNQSSYEEIDCASYKQFMQSNLNPF